ncbi:hypothetical protein O185_19440 [Photorhabdus temperata J3]|nr:hypothetical protein O185_19440 [Photorhabdus temperata J3]
MDSPFLLAILPPGAFIGLGLMLAAKYLIDEKMKTRAIKEKSNTVAMSPGPESSI